MIIAGLQKLSLVDFPGHLASTIFVQGCNFKCGYCFNAELIDFGKGRDLSEDQVLGSFDDWKKIIEGVVITGGEPTVYRDLPGFIKRVRNTGLKIKLDTNGSNPAQIERLLRDRLLDYVAMDIKTSLLKYPSLTDQKNIEQAVFESAQLIMLSTVPYEFRTTCVPTMTDEEDLRLIGKMVRGAKKYCLQQFRPQRTYDEKFQDVGVYTKEDLQRFKNILEEYVEEVELRGV